MRLGTSIVQMSGRTPTSIAMHALTLDHLSNGRVVLGMGVKVATLPVIALGFDPRVVATSA